MKKKSFLPLVTVTMLATALLGGCANKTESTTTSEATPTEAVKEGNIYAGQTISGEVTLDDGGTYTSNGTGSPAVYSTADIAVSGATLTANGSEAVCIEGLNSLRLFDTDLTGNMSDDSQNDCTWTVTGDSHSTSVDTSDAESTTSFSDYEVTQQ